jgi:hypothetical protein
MIHNSLNNIQKRSINLSSEINGWGADLDPALRPGVPRDKAPEIGVEKLYPDIEPQIPLVKINRSIEHGQMPPVFGSTCPPRGLSGMIRNYAYKYSEAKFAHWLPLLFADRVDVVESILIDIAHGRLPNFFAEMGLGSELKYNRGNFQRKMATIGVAAAGLTAVVFWLKGRKETEENLI